MALNLPLDNASRRDWRGLLLVLMALLIYLVGPLSTHLDKKNSFSAEVDWDTMVARIGADSGCGIDPRRAIFLMKPIDLNLADAEVLASLKGIGPKLAVRTIAYRDRRGGFDQVVDITEVKGIGPKKLAGFVKNITVGKCAE
ncbi:MAG: helix-hairpin-helix domain-containing protein [Desulfobulbaceae bacterium]|nr:helix-hairpin-helix domain-containing protein [Desulfobulbaceae bacterium]